MAAAEPARRALGFDALSGRFSASLEVQSPALNPARGVFGFLSELRGSASVDLDHGVLTSRSGTTRLPFTRVQASLDGHGLAFAGSAVPDELGYT